MRITLDIPRLNWNMSASRSRGLKRPYFKVQIVHVEKGPDGETGGAVRQQDLVALVRLIKLGRLWPGDLLQLVFGRRHNRREVSQDYRRQQRRILCRRRFCQSSSITYLAALRI